MAWLEDALDEFKKAKPPEKVAIVAISLGVVGIALYVHHKNASSASGDQAASGNSGLYGAAGSLQSSTPTSTGNPAGGSPTGTTTPPTTTPPTKSPTPTGGKTGQPKKKEPKPVKTKPTTTTTTASVAQLSAERRQQMINELSTRATLPTTGGGGHTTLQ